jgi:glucose-1-phosphate adenylyltransferase
MIKLGIGLYPKKYFGGKNMRSRECIAMLLAGGQGNRLGILTKNVAKPAVPFGGKYRIIDFTLSNCTNSGIDTVGVLTQYRPLKLNSYIGNGQPWDLDMSDGGVSVLPPFVKGKVGEWYKGTASAIYQNIEFIEQYSPRYVLILSGDHIYKMDYSSMLEFHKEKNADVTIASIQVPWEEASRFGIINTDANGAVIEFEEKPKFPKSNKASMGIYIFNWDVLKEYLISDNIDSKSNHDFGKNIIPRILSDRGSMFVYPFDGYWKDVGTIQSLWEANMDLLETPAKFNMDDPSWRIFSRNPVEPPHYIASNACVRRSIIGEGSMIYGSVEHSVIFSGVYIGKDTKVKNSIIMPKTKIEGNCIFNLSIVSEESYIGYGCRLNDNNEDSQFNLFVIGQRSVIPPQTSIKSFYDIDESLADKVEIEPVSCKGREGKDR